MTCDQDFFTGLPTSVHSPKESKTTVYDLSSSVDRGYIYPYIPQLRINNNILPTIAALLVRTNNVGIDRLGFSRIEPAPPIAGIGRR